MGNNEIETGIAAVSGSDGRSPILLSGEREISPAAYGCYIQEGADRV